MFELSGFCWPCICGWFLHQLHNLCSVILLLSLYHEHSIIAKYNSITTINQCLQSFKLKTPCWITLCMIQYFCESHTIAIINTFLAPFSFIYSFLKVFMRGKEKKIKQIPPCLPEDNLNQLQPLASTLTWLLSERVAGGVYHVTEPAVSLKQQTPRDRSE